MEGEARAPSWEGGFFVEGGGEDRKGEHDLSSLALGSHPVGFAACATAAFKQLLYIHFCLLFPLQRAARKGNSLIVDKEETSGPFGIISLIC